MSPLLSFKLLRLIQNMFCCKKKRHTGRYVAFCENDRTSSSRCAFRQYKTKKSLRTTSCKSQDCFFHSARNRSSKITKFQLLRLFKFRYSRSHSHLDTPPWAVATSRISENEKAFNDKVPAAGHFTARTEQRASMVQNSAQQLVYEVF